MEMAVTKQTRVTSYGRKIKKALVDLDMTQVELCSQIGCTKQYLQKILSGERSGEKYLKQIAEVLQIHEDE